MIGTNALRQPDPLIILTGVMQNAPGLLQHSRDTVSITQRVVDEVPGLGEIKKALILGAYLHDIGKVTWPAELHTKFPLSKYDRKVIEDHPRAGANLLRGIWPDVDPLVLEIVALHHTRPGRRGYPPVEPTYPALVVAACEVFSAMTSFRPYRAGTATAAEAIACIEKWAPAEIAGALKIIATHEALQNSKG
ncbi:HD-GYP domain-containing protein [Desulfofundulus thermocisternus]|uniref:HD-GYP domain-containing protein n=1 Tax=Desulfofundulus thermocisternus TaxID=42471 RepID=UPI00217D460B|nr:HD domain-containing protein [Desulfofundulus thermocisternus]